MLIDSRTIEALIAERGTTKKALAQNCGIAAQTLSMVIRRGSCEPKTAGKIASGLSVSVSEIAAR